MNRRMFLQSKLSNTENNYHGGFKPLEQHIEPIFKPIFQSFMPLKDSKELRDFASKPDLNVCKDKTIVILTKETSYEVMNAFMLHLYLNFLANWREYSDFVSKIRLGGEENLKYSSISLTRYYELNFKDNREEMAKYQDVDILFLFASRYIYEGRDGFSRKYYYELLRRLIESRGSVGLVTIVFFNGDDKELKPIEESLFGVPYKKEYVGFISKTHTNKIEKNESLVNEEERF